MPHGARGKQAPSRVISRALFVAIALVAVLVALACAPVPKRVSVPIVVVAGLALLAVLFVSHQAIKAALASEREDALGDAWESVRKSTAIDAGSRPHTPEAFARLVEGHEAGLNARLVALESLLAAVDVAAIGIDSAGRVWFANNAANELFGSGLVDRDIEEVFTQPDIVALAAAARRGSTRQARIRLPRPRGPMILDVSGLPLPHAPPPPPPPLSLPLRPGDTSTSGDGTGPRRFAAVVTFRDVTELATAVQLKTDFVANASHELRTPLAAIRASVETIQDAAGDDPEARARFLRTIASATTRLEDLCRDLMDLSRVETAESSVEFGDVASGALASELTEHFESACATRSLTLRFEIDPRAATVRSDARLLSLILRNLIENSTKFAFERTEIRVAFAPGEGDPRDLVIEVIDQGIGIPIGLQARIFERFFQADPARAGNGKRGTGLGLAIVKHAVRALGGTISVSSVWKQGTTMRVELPDALAEATSTST